MGGRPFVSIYSHGFIRAAVAIPEVKLGNPRFNVERTVHLARKISAERAVVAVFPELGITGYTLDDLVQQQTILEAAQEAILDLKEQTASLPLVLCVGAPIAWEGRLFNTAITLYKGKILGISPKTYLPNYREFYEKRQFCTAAHATFSEIRVGDDLIPFGNNLVFKARNIDGFGLFTEICEDLWAPVPPSTIAALGGATVLANLSASNSIIGKADYRRTIASAQSGKCVAAYLYSAAGNGESTTDLAWDGHGMIYHNGRLVSETPRFSDAEEIIFADLDLERLTQERLRLTSFQDSQLAWKDKAPPPRVISFDLDLPKGTCPLLQPPERFPYVPVSGEARSERCNEAYQIQVAGLIQRLKSSGYENLVIGVSGGLDSTQALIVAVKAMDRLGLPRHHVLAYSMPGFATSEKTRNNALALMKAMGVAVGEIDIIPSCTQMLKDLDHPWAHGKKTFDITFENIQAGERTSHLFRLANQHRALVMGTGDLSELALGWCTYGVGDHMSHYNVNASVPKTLIQHLIRWVAQTSQCGPEANPVLESILDTEISPELVPAGSSRGKAAMQSTQQMIGPYELQDFHLFYLTRFGFRPSKVAFLAHQAWQNRKVGQHTYDLATIKKWLLVFLQRFFGQSQFKRSCVPNGPKVGSGGSLSPRGDWRAPSDSTADVWIEELLANVPDTRKAQKAAP